MTNYICDPQKNYVNRHSRMIQLPSNITQADATKQCMDQATGKDFFLFQRDTGVTVCGILKHKLNSESEYSSQQDSKYGTVCHEPGEVLRYKADEERLKDKLLTRRLR